MDSFKEIEPFFRLKRIVNHEQSYKTIMKRAHKDAFANCMQNGNASCN